MYNSKEIPGYIYVLSNQSMPGIVKIGRTTRDPKTRLRELNSATGVPVPFKLEYAARTYWPTASEKFIHQSINGLRVNAKREFFKLNTSDAIKLCKQATRLNRRDFRTWLADNIAIPKPKRRSKFKFYAISIVLLISAAKIVNDNYSWLF
ncbi:GIY-YIG nuclease family protein [Brucella gallinifaecis]|uniref:GIY-YIG nuclease family protein n=1 Tax=Brucella gallinifaecis TaxID=215590 RepID=UPI00387E88B9